MRRARPFSGIVAAGTLGAGFVLSHWLTYLIVVPHAHEREQLLESTGHGYWPLAATVAAALGLVALAVTASRAVAQARDADLGQQPLRPLVARLAWMQILAFILLEIIERLASGTAGVQFVLHAPFLLGLGVQLVVATLIGLFLSGFARAAARIARVILREKAAARSPVFLQPAQPTAMPARLLGLAPTGVRAPPAS